MARFFSLLVFLCCGFGAFAQDVRITEFLATNTTGIVDQDGAASPWIEIWNPSTVSKVSMSGWKLSNGTTQWTFPGVEIMPDSYLVVWASGKNRTLATAPLHTNFVISPEGGDLTLTPPTASTAAYPTSSYLAYPPQQADVSYGRDGANPALKGFYTKPTPGDANNYTGVGVSGKVEFSVPSTTFVGSFLLTLTQTVPVEGAVIRYTTNGSVPVSTSPVYSAPINVAASQRIRARVFAPDLLPGETDSAAYLLRDANSSNFSSPIPIVVISNFGAGTPPATGDQDAYMWTFEPGPDGRARLTDTPTLITRVGIDRRGSSTLDNPKSNLNVEARKSRDNEDQDISLLGMPPSADWVFHAPFEFDRTLIHNPFAYALSNAVGRYAPRTRMAEVFLDVDGAALTYTNAASGNYFGVYNIVEKIRRGEERVDIENLREYDNSEVAKTGGYILKVDRKDPGDSGFSTPREGSGAGTIGFAYVEPKEMEILAPQRDPQELYIKTFMTAMDNSIFAANYADPVNGYARHLDVDAALDHHLLNVLPMNVDALRLSGYMHKDRGGKLIYGPVWDFDRSMFAMNDGGRSDNPLTWRSNSGDLGTDFFNYTWWRRLFGDIEFYQKYIDRYTNLRRGPFSNASVNALIDSLNASITDEAANRDVTRWGKTKRTYFSPVTGQNHVGQTAEIQRMKDWLQQRQGFMESQWVKPVTIGRASGNVEVGTTVTLSAPAGTIYYTTDGTDPRPPGGGVPTGANVKVYSVDPIVVDSTTRVRARAYNPGHTALTGANNPPLISRWSGRTDARFAVDLPAASGALIVTEINYHPTDPTAAELAVNPRFSDGDFEFIEVKNIGTVPIDLADAELTLGIEFGFTGENALSLEPGAHAIIAANPTAFTLRYGAKPNLVGPFTGDLSNGGERLLLIGANDETILDFTYDDAWQLTTDGGGSSLVVYDQAAATGASDSPANWRASIAVGGTPGADEPPFVTTLQATAITPTSATLSAEVIGNGAATTPEFVFQNVRYPAGNVAGFGPVAVEKGLTELAPHTTYTYRAEATNAFGVRVGEEVTFTTANRAPEALDKQFHFAARAPITFEVLSSDSDPDADPLTVSAVTQGQHGAVTTDGVTIIYEPGTSYTGNDSFTYTVSDEFGGSKTATITLTNTQPIAAADLVLSDGQAVTFDPRTNDIDADNDALAIASVGSASLGSAVINPGGGITYTPGAQFFGRDSFTYTVTDGSASATATVQVRNAAPIAIAGMTKGGEVSGRPGATFASLGLPSPGAFSGTLINGSGPKQKAIFGPDGALRMNVGGAAPTLSGATVKKLGEPSGQAVLVTLKGTVNGMKINSSNDTALYAGLEDGVMRIAAREGDVLPGGLTLKSFGAIDGNGSTIFFVAKLGGASSKNDMALIAALPEGGLRILVREGDGVGPNGTMVVSIATLISSKGTTAEGRWRADESSIGVRLTLPFKQQALYTIPATATSSADWLEWAGSGDEIPGLGSIIAFGLPGFGPDGVAYQAQMNSGDKSNDSVLVKETQDGATLLGREGDAAPGFDGRPLLGTPFKTFSDPIAGTGKSAAFAATLDGPGGKTGLWAANSAGVVRMIARAGEFAPGGGRWNSFESLVLPDGLESGPVFTGKLSNDPSSGISGKSNRGLWGVDSSGTLRLLLRTGGTYEVNGADRVLKSFVALVPKPGSLGAASGFNNDREVSVLATFDDKTQAYLRIAIP
jgi:hypothetical protein